MTWPTWRSFAAGAGPGLRIKGRIYGKHCASMKNYLYLMMLMLCACGEGDRGILLVEDFENMPRGPLRSGSGSGAHTEYHYLPEAAPSGPWAISTFRYNLPESWYIRDTPEGRALVQDALNPDLHWHPMVVAGDALWKDYRVKLRFDPDTNDRMCGLAFRYRNDRCYYFFGIREGKQVLSMVKHATGFREPFEVVLAEGPVPEPRRESLILRVGATGLQIEAGLEGGPLFRVTDSTYAGGKIALLADGPAAFHSILVSSGQKQKKVYEQERAKLDREERERIASNPGMKLWKKVSTEGFGVGRNLRFGDLNGDREMDVLIGQVIHHGPKDRNSELSCLTAMTLDGEVLWQKGRPDPWKTGLTSDVAFQVHDLDNDGKSEVLFCMGQEIHLVEGATGRLIKRVPTPLTPGGKPLPAGQNIFPGILGDCLFFCDLEGQGHDGNLVIKDRYRYLWTYNADLEPVWEASCTTGHYPYAFDTDGDGKDELLMGYTLFDDDGSMLWSLDDRISDHADGVAIVEYREGEDPQFICAASDEGLFFADMAGKILRHHYIGHVQNPAVANFRDDLPGLETVSVNFWGNQGIIHLFDSGGEIYADLEPNQYGSMCLPLNWTGRSEEFIVLNANVDEGGAWDGYGRKVLEFPDDGHPDMCYAVLDITGDCRDEIVVWDPYEIWVYTQDDSPRQDSLYKPVRNPLYNYSNYQATVSLPAWSE